MKISNILDAIRNALGALRPPANVLPTILLICSLIKRPGLSTIVSTANIIKMLAEKGINTGEYEDGTMNYTNVLVSSIVTEIYRALRYDANVQICIKPGEIMFNGTGANGGGPVNVTGVNVNIPGGFAQIQ